jgi:hypothetical protein
MAKRGPTQSRLSKPINYYLDKLFKNTLITWIQSSEIAGVNAYQASKSFLVYFRIDESEYSHDAAYKYWTRWKRQGIKK